MKKMILSLMLLANLAMAQSMDFSDSDSEVSVISAEKLRWQYEISGEILVFEKTGTRLQYKASEERRWNFTNEKPIVAIWSYKQKGIPEVAIQHQWQADAEGHLEAQIKQYESMKKNSKEEVEYGKLVTEKTIKIENLDPISWVIFQDDNRRVVVKFNVHVWADEAGTDIGKVGINSSRMTIYDGKGVLWASRLDLSSGNNVFLGISTHMGTIYMSYLPFKGAKKIGTSQRNRIKIEDGPNKLYIESPDAFLPRGITANVYGYFDFNKRTERYNQVKSNGGDNLEKFQKRIEKP